jgi:hypothetical protein
LEPLTVAVPSEAEVDVATVTVAPASVVPVMVWLHGFVEVDTGFRLRYYRLEGGRFE